MASQKILLALAALACLVAIASTQSLDDELETVLRSRRAAQGVLRGYAGTSRRGDPLVFVGGYATHTRHVPRYAARPSNVEEQEVDPEEEPVEPMVDEEEPVEDEEEQVEDSVEEEPMEEEMDAVEDKEEQDEEPTPIKADRGYPARPRPTAGKPTRPQKPLQEDDEEGGNSGRGGVTAIASSVSHGQGASSKSQAIAYGARFSRGQYRYRY